MKLRIQRISGITSAMQSNSSAVDVECDMNERQMHDALMQFLEHISEELWQQWIEDAKP